MRSGIQAVVVLVIAVSLAACGSSVASSTPSPTVAPIPTPTATAVASVTLAPTLSPAPTPTLPPPSQAPASPVAGLRCAETDNAKPSATVQWDEVMGPEATIKAGQAVLFVTTGFFPSVTEWIDGQPAANPCIDKRIGQDAGPMKVVVTFYQPGDYNITCRRMPEVMHTVVHVK